MVIILTIVYVTQISQDPSRTRGRARGREAAKASMPQGEAPLEPPPPPPSFPPSLSPSLPPSLPPLPTCSAISRPTRLPAPISRSDLLCPPEECPVRDGDARGRGALPGGSASGRKRRRAGRIPRAVETPGPLTAGR